MYSQQSYGALHAASPHPSVYPAGAWGQQPPHQPNPSPAGPMQDPTLPPGWLKQWNQQYQTWFFVNTYAQPPISQWIHPAHSVSPAGPPPMMTTDATRAHTQASYSASNFTGPGPSGSYQTAAAPQFNGQATGTLTPRQAMAIPGTKQATPASQGGGKGAGLMAAGVGAMGGLALGGLLSHEWKEHQHREHRREDEAYAAGLEQGEHQREHAFDRNNDSYQSALDESSDNDAYQQGDEDQSNQDDGDW
ncbi:hypothetical protein PCANC_03645 [Puccinia coronata f. sp. avenae]|uniref:WW domain-containing protein n=1 Tax=Puccinia coronata f. sp. avenae TaxID=200324 RepID=A0A2N5VXK8_9BASI|nr:hypothetical protein PCASD_25364 [Puccinia coronata f. sp. avenae]PLW21215.1 hypothetical protein PCANC_05394 [Puccinia coronata f. sp. avenae]PLW46246.1 hypothetical protein PCASD_03802 [Puccinia coronata f. sp. avenae]PLW54724.1 hypothetical protein PCANC_03645 [Puccinia coronata f. sp. avenae]